MRRAGAVAGAVALAALLALGACGRSDDPYERFKPAQLLDEGDRLLRQGDEAGAEKALRLGLERAEAAGADALQSRAFITRLFHLAVKRGDAEEAERLVARLGAPIDVRAAHDSAVLLFRQGKLDEARGRGEVLARALASQQPIDPHGRAIHAAAWMTIDRLRTARYDREAAREASDEVVAALVGMSHRRARFEPLPPGLRAWILRYLDHLHDTERRLVALEIADLVQRIDENAPSEGEAPCLPLDPALANLGCLQQLQTE